MFQQDPVKEFAEYRNEYLRSRGAFKSGGQKRTPWGQLIQPANTLIPKTTWGDVMAFGIRYIAAQSNQAIINCLKEGGDHVSGGDSSWMDIATANVGGTLRCGAQFYESADYKKALALFSSWTPQERYSSSHNGMAMMHAGVAANTLYPHNEEFWGYGARLSIARSVAGSTMFPLSFLDHIGDATKALPGRLKAAARAVANITPGLPNMSWIGDMMKWGTIAGGAYLLYWLMKNRK